MFPFVSEKCDILALQNKITEKTDCERLLKISALINKALPEVGISDIIMVEKYGYSVSRQNLLSNSQYLGMGT